VPTRSPNSSPAPPPPWPAARSRTHSPGGVRVPPRGGTVAYFAAYDVHRAQVLRRIAPKAGIGPFTDLVAQAMTTERYAFARRVFPVVDNGSSHIWQRSIDRVSATWPKRDFGPSPGARVLVNQVEIYFSILQRKAISPADLDHLAERVLAFHERYNTAAGTLRLNLPPRRPQQFSTTTWRPRSPETPQHRGMTPDELRACPLTQPASLTDIEASVTASV